MTLTDHEQVLTEKLLILPDAQERLSALVQRASRLPALTGEEQVTTNLVPGCVSAVWLVKSFRAGQCHFRATADSPLVAGLVTLLVQLFDGHAPAEITTFHPQIFMRLGIWRNLSPTRQHGLNAVMQTIRDFATSCL